MLVQIGNKVINTDLIALIRFISPRKVLIYTTNALFPCIELTGDEAEAFDEYYNKSDKVTLIPTKREKGECEEDELAKSRANAEILGMLLDNLLSDVPNLRK